MSPQTQSGFNAFIQNYLWLTSQDPDGSFATLVEDTNGVTSFTMKNADDIGTGDEAGDFEIWRGTTKANLALIESKTIAAGTITATIAPAAGTYFYALNKVTGDTPAQDCSRCGIFELLNEVP